MSHSIAARVPLPHLPYARHCGVWAPGSTSRSLACSPTLKFGISGRLFGLVIGLSRSTVSMPSPSSQIGRGLTELTARRFWSLDMQLSCSFSVCRRMHECDLLRVRVRVFIEPQRIHRSPMQVLVVSAPWLLVFRPITGFG